MKKISSFLLLTFLTISCSVKYETKGHLIEDQDVRRVIPNSSKEDVEAILGTPTSKSLFGNEIWYYLSYRTKNTPLSNPTPTHYDAVIVEFANNKVKSIKTEKDKTFIILSPIPETTPVKGKDSSLIGDFLSNIGKYTTESKKEKTPDMPSSWD